MVLLQTPVPAALQNLLLASLPILISIFANVMQTTDFLFSKVQSLACWNCQESFDFIVVGGGSAGCAIAARLSQDSSVRVLLLEAGGDPNPISYVPFFAPALGQPSIDWGYNTVPLRGSGRGLPNNTLFWPRGRSLGGSSTSNFMMYMRGNPNDFDNWAQVSGDPRWAYQSVEQVFRRMEDYNGNWGESPGHGKGGPLSVEAPSFRPGLDNLLRAAAEIGFPILDPNAFQTRSFFPLDLTQRRGTRWSTFSAYIKPSTGRANLVIRRYAHVTRIHIDITMRATGVTYLRHGKSVFVAATKEVVVSGGSINSPQLLMLSGIGPRRHLEEHGIEPLLDLPGVGSNLQDHVCTAYGPFLLNEPVTFLPERDLTFQSLLDYARDGSGPLAVPLMSIVGGLSSTSGISPNWPNILYLINSAAVSAGSANIFTNFLRTADNVFPGLLGRHVGQDAHFVWITLTLPKSRGEIRLRDRNPLSRPIIDPRYYSDERGEDLDAMVEALDVITRMFENTTSLGARYGARLIPTELPGCEGFGRHTRGYRECCLRTLTLTLYYPAGTCAMGKVGDPGTVVDSELRVVGVRGLRVTNANTNAPSIMIGEMCAIFMKQAWNLS